MQKRRETSIEPSGSDTFSVLPGRADAGLLLLCDHAGNAFPPGYGTLGLPENQLQRHIAYDIGAAEVTRQLSVALGAPAVMTRYSRLLIDPNRGEDDPTLIMRLSDGAIVPGNRVLTAEEREKRLRLYYRPYHEAISRVLDRCLASGVTPVILSVHSFTESWKNVSRPWHAGVLWGRDSRLAEPLIEALHAANDLIVGVNEPYAGQYEGDTLWQHGTRRGLAHAIIEIRQDLIRDLAGQTAWAERLTGIMRTLLASDKAQPGIEAAGAPGPLTSRAAGPMSKPNPVTVSEDRMPHIDDTTRTELEAAAFRRLLAHLRERKDVQNIDLMNFAGFCRNCLARWYQEAANASGHAMSKEEAREVIYGMPYPEWQAKHQKEASPEQKAAYEKARPRDH